MKIAELFHERIYNISNFLSIFRAFLIIPIYILSDHYIVEPRVQSLWPLALAVILAALSDALDGFLARALNQQTTLGRYLDPICDKIVIIGSMILLSRDYMFPWWVLSFFLIREVGILVLAIFLYVKRDVHVQPNKWGKAGIGFVSISIFWYICVPYLRTVLPVDHIALQPILSVYAAVFVVAVSVLIYARDYSRELGPNRTKKS